MNEKKMAGVFLWSLGGPAGMPFEKRKNESLIVSAQSGEKQFSWDVFPNSMRDQAFDPGYAERVATGACSLAGWPEPAVGSHQIFFRAYITQVQIFVFTSAVKLPVGDAAFAYDGLLTLPDGSIYQMSPWGDWDGMQAAISAAVKRRDAAKDDVRSPGFQKKLGEFVEKFMGKADEKFRKYFNKDVVAAMPEPAAVSSPEVSSPIVQSEYGCTPEETMALREQAMQTFSDRWGAELNRIAEESVDPRGAAPASPEVSSPSPVSPLKTLYELDAATGKASVVAPESAGVSDVLPPPGFVAVPLPDDGKPVLDYCRKPGHYLTFNGLFVDLTYNVGTGVDQIEGKLEFPWVHFDPLRRGLAWHVFYTPYGKAHSWNGLADGRNQFSYLPAYDVVKRCVSVASDSPQDVQAAREATAGPATVNDVPDLTIEQIQQAVGPDCVVTVNFTPKNQAYRCAADAEYRLLEKGEVIQEGDEIDCCVNPMKDDAKWLKATESMVGKPAPDSAYPAHRLFRRKVEKDTVAKPDASAVEPHVVTSPASDSCGVNESELRRLFHEKTMKEGSCGCGTCFGIAKPYLVEVVKLRSDLRDSSKIVEEMSRALGGEKQAAVEAREKCDMLEIKNGRLDRQLMEACRERDSLAGKFGTAMAQRDLARESLARAEKDVADVKATLGKRDAECDNLRREVERLNAEFAPRDNGDGTVTAMKPVTYPKELDVVEVRSPKRGDHFVSGRDTTLVCNLDSIDGVRLILRPVQKPPEPVTWEAPALTDGLWKADIYEVENDEFGLPWGALRGITKPAKLGTYQFKDGVGTLIKEERKEGSE